ncbi:PREDICTED: probable apyrase 7 [Nicotiana attenuata]|uniref:Apyrase 7 n=1 Tax=Nicotiana attenuata TaxID=49451 RepID=A0A314KSU9_NICAT|nr:PREDICTED: probable apyrase 7 [Nicotiana attenuata]OIT32400.1 putative apyrase 7 [Nicotiana attenuata]
MDPRWPSKSKLYVSGADHNPRMQKIGIIAVSIVFIFVLIGGCFVFSPSLVYNVEKSSSSYFTVVVDCGSSGTRVNIYEWKLQGRLNNNGDLPILLNTYPGNLTKSDGCQYHCMQTEPGLDKFVGNAFGVRSSLDPLLHWAERLVPRERREFTPIFVLATAGMRKLPVEDARVILEDVADVVKDFGFLYKKDWIRVLSGKEEAYYGWIALNYKMGVLGNSLGSHTLGLLDLGGSSLQLVVEVDELKIDNYVFNSKIGSPEHQIVPYSLPAFGLNEAFDRTVVMLSRTQALKESPGGAFEVRHPCLCSGFVQNYTCLSCFQREPISSDLGSHINANAILLLGEPNWEMCKSLTRAVATNSSRGDWSLVHDHASCSGLSSYGGNELLNLMLNSSSVTRYHALSGFFAVYQMLNLSPRANLTRMWETGQQLCSQSWEDHQGIGGAYCFRFLYMISLIQDALCLSKREIVFGPGDVSWTLGAALIEGQYLWSDATKYQYGIFYLKHSKMLSSSVALFLLLLCLLLIVYRSQIKLPMPGGKPTASRASLPSYIYSKRQPN